MLWEESQIYVCVPVYGRLHSNAAAPNLAVPKLVQSPATYMLTPRHQVTIRQTCTIAGLSFSCLASAYALALLAASAFPAASTIDARLLRLPVASWGGLCLLCAERRVTPSEASLLRAGPPRVVLLTVLSVQQLTSSSNLTHTRTIHRQAMQ